MCLVWGSTLWICFIKLALEVYDLTAGLIKMEVMARKHWTAFFCAPQQCGCVNDHTDFLWRLNCPLGSVHVAGCTRVWVCVWEWMGTWHLFISTLSPLGSNKWKARRPAHKGHNGKSFYPDNQHSVSLPHIVSLSSVMQSYQNLSILSHLKLRCNGSNKQQVVSSLLWRRSKWNRCRVGSWFNPLIFDWMEADLYMNLQYCRKMA